VAVRRLKETGFPDDPILVAWRGMRTLLGNDRAIVITGKFECYNVFQKKVHASCSHVELSDMIIRYVIKACVCNIGSRDSAVCIATCYRLGGRGVGVRVPVGARFFSSSRRPASYPMGTGGKAAGARSLPLTSI
jgi:hypothetical protein